MSLIKYLNPNAIKDGSIEGIKIKDDSIEGIKLKDASIEGIKIKDDSIEATKIKDGAISVSKIDETIASKTYVDDIASRNKGLVTELATAGNGYNVKLDWSLDPAKESTIDPAYRGQVNLGASCTTSNAFAYAEGGGNISSGNLSHAEGNSNTASGNSSHAEGQKNTVSGSRSHVEGYTNVVSGIASHAEGISNTASGNGSHVEGGGNTASGNQSHAEGYNTIASGIDSHSEGAYSIASGFLSHAEGTGTVASGDVSHAGGSNTVASGDTSSAVIGSWVTMLNLTGDANTTTYICNNISEIDVNNSDELSYIIGPNNYGYIAVVNGNPINPVKITSVDTATGTIEVESTLSADTALDGVNCSISATIAYGNYSFAARGISAGGSSWTVNRGGFAKGTSSFVGGNCNSAYNDSEVAFGHFNKSIESTDTAIAPIATIGIGVDKDHRKNAYEIKQNGDAYLIDIGGYDGTNSDSATRLQDAIASKEYVANTIAAAITASDAMVFKGTLGTGGTTESIPSTAVVGDTYKVISLTTIPLESSYTGAEETAKAGDLVVAISADPKWVVVPSGDDEIKTLVQSITWGELKTLRDAGELIPGMQYRITDYQCTTTQENTKSAGHQFDIIVRADSNNKLNEEASAIQHEGDKYFANNDLSTWKIWYCLDNDFYRFSWAVIGELIDTIKPTNGSASGTYTYNVPISKIIFNNQLYNLEIGVKTTINGGPPTYITKIDDYTLVIEDKYNVITRMGEISVYTVSQKGKGVIYRMIDEFNNDCPYDFKNIQFKHPNDSTKYPYYYYTFTYLSGVNYIDYSLRKDCYLNIINKYINVKEYKRVLNNIIFIGVNFYCNFFGEGCYNNTFEHHCYCNFFGSNCYNNVFESDSCFNTFGSNFINNTISGNNNFFGNSCKYIKFALDKDATTKYKYYRYNHFGDGCQYIVFKGAETASLSAQVQNYNFAQGLQGTSNEYLTIDGVRNRSYETKVAQNSNGELKIYCEADLIK